MSILRLYFVAFGILLLAQACSDSKNNASKQIGAYIVSSGMLAIDTQAAKDHGLEIFDQDSQLMDGIVPLRSGLVIKRGNKQSSTIGQSPNALIIFDANQDGLINDSDPLWQAMHLAVDYNDDGVIGDGEYALIGECGVDALKLDDAAGKVWSQHTGGDLKLVKSP